MSGSNSDTRLFVGHLSSATTVRDLEHIFGKHGRVCRVNLKSGGYAFVDFADSLDAAKAIHHLHGVELNNRHMIVEFATAWTKAKPLCQDCKECYKCGEKGHIGRNCTKAQKNISRERWSPSPSHRSSHGRRRRSYRSRTPPKGDPRPERLPPSPSRVQNHSGRRQSYSRSRSPPIRDLRRERDRPASRNHNSQSQGWQHPLSGRCFKCGSQNHQARDCKENECFRCGEMGHIKKDCMKVHKSISRSRSPPDRDWV